MKPGNHFADGRQSMNAENRPKEGGLVNSRIAGSIGWLFKRSIISNAVDFISSVFAANINLAIEERP